MRRLLILIAPILLLNLAACSPVAVPLPSLDGTEPAPDIVLPTPEGDLLALSDFRGQAVFINFWGTYCPPCVKEMPILQALYEEYADRGLMVLGVNVEEEPEKVRAWTQEHGVTFPIVISDDGTVNPIFGLRAMPTTWFVDANGILRGRIDGEMNAATARGVAEKLLRK
ncbi:MAG: TlpA family protein disulfide reductase [Chloroflexi bacterium]|nr:TlpA family protein disulfide reductase [Chloroflexota bacterium]